MFTGIIEGLGTIAGVRSSGQGKRLTIQSDFGLQGSRVGDSIAVNGACLTAVQLAERRFEADVSPETLARTTLGEARTGERVNLERALRLSDRIDGHLVAGHVDGTGAIASRRPAGNALVVTVTVPAELTRQMIVKGSVAVDGVSLTINTLEAGRFAVAVIPHTSALTTIGFKKEGERVNIETDMIGKYVEKFLSARGEAGPTGVTLDLLAKAGYLMK
jgi:riboflavin synthase